MQFICFSVVLTVTVSYISWMHIEMVNQYPEKTYRPPKRQEIIDF